VVTLVPINLFSPDPSNALNGILFIFVNFNVFPFNPVFLNAYLLRVSIENVYSVLSFIWSKSFVSKAVKLEHPSNTYSPS
jgi:hypothetical protein